MNRVVIASLVVMYVLAMSTLIYIANAQVSEIDKNMKSPQELSDTPNADSITIDNSGRREYVYCPVDIDTLGIELTYELNGCPIARIYIDNWLSMTVEEQNAIHEHLINNGFKDVGAVDSKQRGH